MEEEILRKITEQEEKLEKIYRSVEKTRKYLFWSFIISIVVFVLPLIGLIVIIPWFLNAYTSTLDLF